MRAIPSIHPLILTNNSELFTLPESDQKLNVTPIFCYTCPSMTVDQVSNTAASLLDMIKKVGIVENQPIPSVKILQNLVALSSRQGREYGVQLYEMQTEEGNRKASTYIKGEKDHIWEPKPPQHTQRGIFFHTHPELKSWLNQIIIGSRIRPWYMLPSDTGFHDMFYKMVSGRGGDIVATVLSARLAGYLNIASPYGLTLRLGEVNDPSNTQLKDSEWEMLFGSQKGKVVSQPQKLAFDRHPIYDPVMVWRNRWPHGNTNFFLLLSWGKLQELTPVFNDLDNICFGDGVEKIAQHLQLDVVPQANLTAVPRFAV